MAWVTFDAPDRDGGGGQIRQSYLLEQLAARADVDLYVAAGEPDAVVSSLGVRVLRMPGERTAPSSSLRRRAHAVWMAAVGPEEYWVGSRARAWLRPRLGASYSVVVVEAPGLFPLVGRRRRRQGQAWIATVHNVGSERARQQATATVGRRQAWLVAREARLAARREAELLPRYDSVITVSDRDARLVLGPTTTVPNGVDLERLLPAPLPSEPRVVLTGTLGYQPNVDGIMWLFGEVWPRVRAEVPDARLALVGRRPFATVAALDGRDGVTVIPDVPLIAPHLAAARVAVVPLRVGSGTRLKALDAMAAGRPVVGTSIGLEGLDVTDDVEVLVRDDPSEFAEAIVALLLDDALATSLALRGRRFVETRHGWHDLGARFARHVLATSETARG